MEKNYDFRERLRQVHKPARKNDAVYKNITGAVVDDAWQIVFPDDSAKVVRNAAMDLQEYFEISMDCYVKAVPVSRSNCGQKILLQYGLEASPSSYRLMCDGENITIIGSDDRGIAQGCYYLEDLMNLNEGPVLEKMNTQKSPLYLPRMTHSGYGLDMYPEEYLRTLAHFGMDAILVFVKDLNITAHGYLDFNDTIRRAADWGIDIYAYSRYNNKLHPDDPGAREHYDSMYGQLFNKCPGLKGIVFVGESCEFPSKDPHVMNTTRLLNQYAKADPGKWYPGWYPCCDYPQWVSMVRDVIREKDPTADIVFWTYNWAPRDKEARLELIRNLPKDISLQATFEMGDSIQISDTITSKPADYTLSFVGPSPYFESEARQAGECGLTMYTMSNTGGATWDIGVIPYVPAPYTWKKRWDAMKYAHDHWNLRGLMECHHYGFYPSFVAELHKAHCWSPVEDFDSLIRKIAVRDYGAENADQVLKAWKLLSDGMQHYACSAYDQYGPCRIGPSYPLLMMKIADIPTVPYAFFGGNKICSPMYQHDITLVDQLHYDIARFERMEQFYRQGADILEEILPKVPENKQAEARRMLGVARFVQYSIVTTLNAKRWHMLKARLGVRIVTQATHKVPSDVYLDESVFTALSTDERKDIIHEMEAIAEAEIENARRTIPLVQFDSRLGYEPSMEYMCDEAHIQWKIKVTLEAVKNELLPMLDR